MPRQALRTWLLTRIVSRCWSRCRRQPTPFGEGLGVKAGRSSYMRRLIAAPAGHVLALVASPAVQEWQVLIATRPDNDSEESQFDTEQLLYVSK